MKKLNVMVAQLNPIVGDLDANIEKMWEAYEKGISEGVDLVVYPEMIISGYPIEDLALSEAFIDSCEDAVQKFVSRYKGYHGYPAMLFGAPVHNDVGGTCNAAFLYDPDPDCLSVQYTTKQELPNYGVFDEKRVFGTNAVNLFEFRGIKIGAMICEDCWFPTVSKKLASEGADILISINGSPYEVGKNAVREQVINDRIKETGLPFLYVNMVGGQDELVFDGGSFVMDQTGIKTLPCFKEVVEKVEIDLTPVTNDFEFSEPSGIASIYNATVLGLRDYIAKQNFESVVLGMSGGVDSGLVAAIAVDALGADKVHLIRLPSKYSSEGSLTDAANATQRLGAHMRTINIEPVVEALREAYGRIGTGELVGTAAENIQARTRGNILMAISNNEGHILLSTGNRSEISCGFFTIYGDACGGFNPIKDCYKTTVWDLCRYRNQMTGVEISNAGYFGPETVVVPEEIINKPPSAELAPDQKDEDSLPPYPVLDAILKLMIEGQKGNNEIINDGFEKETVIRIRKLLDRAEYKRRQSAPGVKITSKLHGKERRFPIVNHWNGE